MENDELPLDADGVTAVVVLEARRGILDGNVEREAARGARRLGGRKTDRSGGACLEPPLEVVDEHLAPTDFHALALAGGQLVDPRNTKGQLHAVDNLRRPCRSDIVAPMQNPRWLAPAASVFFLAPLAGCGAQNAPVDAALPTDAAVPDDLAETCLPTPPDGASYPDPTCPIDRPLVPDALDETLKLAGLDRCSLGFSNEDWKIFPTAIREDPFRLPWYDAVHDHAVRAPPYGRSLVKRLDDAAVGATPVTDALRVAAAAIGAPSTTCIAPPEIDADQPLARAVARLIEDAGGTPDSAALVTDAMDVPRDLQIALAGVVLAVSAANQNWLALAKPLSDDDLDALSRVTALLLPEPFAGPQLTLPTVVDLLARRFDEAALIDGAVRLAYAVETARLARFAGLRGFTFDAATPIGRIVLRDGGNDIYNDDPKHPIALLVDCGGDDTYYLPAGAIDGSLDLASPRHVALLIDLAGKDSYSYIETADPFDGQRLPSDSDGRYHPPARSEGKVNGPISLSDTPRQGAARMGYGMLFDLGTEGDHYRSLRMSQGFGAAGVGVLFDAGGDDLYEGEAGVQGAAEFGVGLLLDEGGDDTYKTYTDSQGFGYVKGAGILYDSAGHDTYFSDSGDPKVGGDPIYLSPQLPCDQPRQNPNDPSSPPVALALRTNCGNSSLSQGAGFGRRAPCLPGTDCVNMSGGVGILRDRVGDDRYTTSVFGQGAGYWFGTGILADGAGDDSYDGKWYVQGSSAHFALALFFEDAGDDKYNLNLLPSATSIGVGHDFSVSWHIDLGGNDIYRAPGLALGSGNANGIGVLINLGGDDQYHSAGEPSLGCGNLSGEVDQQPSRRARPTDGIFIDIGGKDLYDVPGSTIKRGDNLTWLDVREMPPLATEHGAGLDRDTGSVSLP